MTDSASIARLLVAVADSIEERNAPASAGICRVAARRLVEQERQLRELGRVRTDASCPWCGRPVEQPKTGRPRVFCSSSCRKAASRKTA